MEESLLSSVKEGDLLFLSGLVASQRTEMWARHSTQSCNPSTQEAEAGGVGVQSQAEVHKETAKEGIEGSLAHTPAAEFSPCSFSSSFTRCFKFLASHGGSCLKFQHSGAFETQEDCLEVEASLNSIVRSRLNS